MESLCTVALSFSFSSSWQRSSFWQAVRLKSSMGAPSFPLWFMLHRIKTGYEGVLRPVVSQAHALCPCCYQPLMHNRLWVDWRIIVKVMNIWEHSTGVFGGGGKVNVIGFGLRLGHALNNLWVWTDFRNTRDHRHWDSFNPFFQPVDPLEANARRTVQIKPTIHTCHPWTPFHQS